MRLLDWFKNLKWIKAIREYDSLKFYEYDLTNQNDQLTESRRCLTQWVIELQAENETLKEQLSQCKMVFQTHRNAAAQSIHEASKAEAEYRRKMLNG